MNDTYLVARRHVCGQIVYADLQSDYPVFYNRWSATKNKERLIEGKRPILSCPSCEYPLTMDWMIPLYLVEPMPYELAILTVARRACSNCWGMLRIENNTIPVYDEELGIERKYVIVLCELCRYETRAYVTHKWIGRAREKDYLDYGHCLMGLSEALELPQEGLPIKLKKSKEANLAELGF